MNDIIQSKKYISCNKQKIIECTVNLFKNIDHHLNKNKLRKFVEEVFQNYNEYNRFHNFKHAFEVFLFCYKLILNVKTQFSLFDKKLLLICALCHDIKHRGVPNIEFPKTRSFELYFIDKLNSFDYNNGIDSPKSYNEKIHIQYTTFLTSKYKKTLFLKETFSESEIKTKIESLLFATDISLHKSYLNVINSLPTRLNILLLILKVADLSHILLSFDIHLYWVFNIKLENKIDLTNWSLSDIALDTVMFFNRFLKPMLDLLNAKFPNEEFIKDIQNRFKINIEIWESYI